MEYFAGLDVSLRSCALCIVDNKGTTLFECEMPCEIDEIALCLTSFPHEVKHGVFNNFRYYYQEKWFYSFIPNQQSLLWYFRRPLLNKYTVDIVSLQNQFGEVRVNSGNEITVRLNNFEDAARITAFLQ